MSRQLLSLESLREAFSNTWILVFFGLAFAVSQLAMVTVVHGIGLSEFFWLQCLGFRADDYVGVFGQWEQAGAMELYRAHLIIDDLHWVWYSALLTSVLARVLRFCSPHQRHQAIVRAADCLLIP